MQCKEIICRSLLGALCVCILGGVFSHVWGTDEKRYFLAYVHEGLLCTNNLVSMEAHCKKNKQFPVRLVQLTTDTTPDEAEKIVRWMIDIPLFFKDHLESIDCPDNPAARDRIFPLLKQYVTKEKGFVALKHTWWCSEVSIPQQFWIFIASCWRRTESPPLLHDKRE